jgi:hypothetical protein
VERWHATGVYWEVPFSAPVEVLLERVLEDNELYHKHLYFQFGPVTDSFSFLVFARPDDFVLLFLRNNHYGQNDDELPRWNRYEIAGEEPEYWISVTIPRVEFWTICMEAGTCLERVWEAHEKTRGK